MTAKIKFTEEQTKDIVSRYTAGASLKEVAREYLVDPKVIRREISKSGIDIRQQAVYENKEGLFSTTNEHEAYWTGFIAADGCLASGKYGYLIELGLQVKDYEHLTKFRDFLGASNPITRNRNLYRIRVADKTAYENLVLLGVTPQKTLTLKIDDSLVYNRHFWRGFVDGDGCWYRDKNHKRLGFRIVVGSQVIMEQFQTFCASIGLAVNLHIQAGKYYFISMRKRQSELLAHYLYDVSHVSLDRKRKIIYNED